MTQNQSAREDYSDLPTTDPTNPAHRLAKDIQGGLFKRADVANDVAAVVREALRLSSGGQGSSAARIPTALPDGLLDDLERLATVCATIDPVGPGWYTYRELSQVMEPCDARMAEAITPSTALKLIESVRTGVRGQQALAPDLIELVVAARVVAFEDQGPEAIKRLDKASEAFADRVPWDDEPLTDHPQQQGEKP